MNNEVTKGSNGQMNYTSGQGGGFWSYIDSLPLRYVGNRFYTGEYVADLEEENKTLKFQLQELNQANVNLFNEGEKLKKELKDKTKYVYEKIETRKVGQIIKSEVEIQTYDECLQKQRLKIKELEEQLETKEIINQDLAKKYQLLQEEIDAYDINTLELVEKHSKLEQDYNELQGKYNNLREFASNALSGDIKVNLQHRVKPYLSEGVINVIVESNKEFK